MILPEALRPIIAVSLMDPIDDPFKFASSSRRCSSMCWTLSKVRSSSTEQMSSGRSPDFRQSLISLSTRSMSVLVIRLWDSQRSPSPRADGEIKS